MQRNGEGQHRSGAGSVGVTTIALVAWMIAGCIESSPTSQMNSDTDDRRLSALDDAGWSDPVNLGPVINSSSADQNPSLSKDGLALFFASNRPGGFDGLDIYVAHRGRHRLIRANHSTLPSTSYIRVFRTMAAP